MEKPTIRQAIDELRTRVDALEARVQDLSDKSRRPDRRRLRPATPMANA